MFPILVAIGPFKLLTIVPVAFIAFFAGLFVVWKRGKELHFEEKDLFDVVFVVLLWMFIGSRIGYVLIHLQDFWGNFGKAVNFVGHPGWYFPAGLVSGALAVQAKAKKYKWDMYQLLDLFATGLVLTQALMSLGQFLAGVGYGLPTTWFIGLPFAGVYDRRYPVQLGELAGYAACFGYLWWAEGVYRTFSWYKRNRSQAATGFLVSLYLIWWAGVSLLASLFKTPELVWHNIRFDIILGGVELAGGIWLLLYRAGVTLEEVWERFLNYFGLGKSHHQKVKDRLDNIRSLLDE